MDQASSTSRLGGRRFPALVPEAPAASCTQRTQPAGHPTPSNSTSNTCKGEVAPHTALHRSYRQTARPDDGFNASSLQPRRFLGGRLPGELDTAQRPPRAKAAGVHHHGVLTQPAHTQPRSQATPCAQTRPTCQQFLRPPQKHAWAAWPATVSKQEPPPPQQQAAPPPAQEDHKVCPNHLPPHTAAATAPADTTQNTRPQQGGSRSLQPIPRSGCPPAHAQQPK